MKDANTLSPQAALWPVMTLTFLLIPHWVRFPLALLPVGLLCLIWRYNIHKKRWSSPGLPVRLLFMVLGFSLVATLPYYWFSLETTVAILLLGVSLKLIEMQTIRDLRVLAFLAYLVITAQLLFDQGLLSAFYMLIGILLSTASLLAINLSTSATSIPQRKTFPARFSAGMMLMSVPLMIAGFIIFPRLPPFWAMPGAEGSGKTGISEQMTPGTIGKLMESTAPAFRVEFEGEIPDASLLYWRGPVLGDYDGVSWRRYRNPGYKLPYFSSETGDQLIYRQILEPTYNQWAFPLATPTSGDGNLNLLPDHTVRTVRPITQKTAFTFTSDPVVVRDERLSTFHKQQNLRLPEDMHPETRSVARELKATSDSPEVFLAKVQAFYQSRPYIYTLQPPLYTSDSVDDFLFSGLKGFCEHFAGSFVVIMRAGGIPARVVTGYQGGSVNPYEGYVLVRQMDAHAWAEVWLDSRGWIRIDPTAWVAPERVQLGSEAALMQDEAYREKMPLSAIQLSRFAWYQAMRNRFDQMNYLWARRVVAFNEDQKNALISLLIDTESLLQKTLLMIAVFSSIFFLFFLMQAIPPRRKKLSPAEKQYRRLLKKLKKKGVIKPGHQGPADFLKQLSESHPVYARQVAPAISLYVEMVYGKLQDNNRAALHLKQLRTLINAL